MTTGSERLDKLLGGGREVGLMHLFYGNKILREDILRIAVNAQLPESRGRLEGSVIVVDSSNIESLNHLTDLSFHAED